MSIYRDRVLPHLINVSMRNHNLMPYRSRVVSAAEGRVLEIGIGSGFNLPFYDSRVPMIIGLDPAPKLLAMARQASRQLAPSVELISGSAEAIPLADASVDTVLTTWTLCSIPDVRRALTEMQRVLKPAGRMLFVEHGRAPEASVRRWQERLTPLWRRFSGGCHLDRPIDELIASSGFQIERLANGYMRGPKPMTFMYEGSARPR